MTNSVLYWNCCGGMASKIDSIKMIINDYQPDVFFIGESELKKDTPLDWFKIKGYEIIPSLNYSNSKARLVVYHKSNLKVKIIHPKIQGLELIRLNMGKINVVGMYRPFLSRANLSFRAELEALLKEVDSLSNEELIICGDLNVNWIKDNAEKRILLSFMDNKSLVQPVKKATWRRTVTTNDKTDLRTSILDLVFHNTGAAVSVEDQWTSDHSLIKIQVDLSLQRNVVHRRKHWTRDWKKYDLNNVQEFISEKTKNHINEQDLDTFVLGIQTEVQKIFCPLRRVRTARPSDIVTNTVEKLKKKRKRLLYQYNKNPNQTNILEKVNQLNVKIKNAIKDERKRIIDTKLKSPMPRLSGMKLNNYRD